MPYKDNRKFSQILKVRDNCLTCFANGFSWLLRQRYWRQALCGVAMRAGFKPNAEKIGHSVKYDRTTTQNGYTATLFVVRHPDRALFRNYAALFYLR
ncbi:hypothetical protein [uncultured Alistipes sp.]|uniref:hypothetical protein n=1 Tax=uncultured Alistipes sp. TaxID=538949 RepID=UPI00272C1C8E|nr:hypothetical protein [uncultured Alistipes sp.]